MPRLSGCGLTAALAILLLPLQAVVVGGRSLAPLGRVQSSHQLQYLPSLAELETEVKACHTQLRNHRSALAACASSGRNAEQRQPPECNCFCPTCAPDFPDLADLPPCPTPGQPLKVVGAPPWPKLPPLLPLPKVEVPSLLEEPARRRAAAAQEELRSCRQDEQDSASLLQSRGCAGDGAGFLRHLRRQPQISQCNCNCPPCDAWAGSPPTCNPGDGATTAAPEPAAVADSDAGKEGTPPPLTMPPSTTWHLPPIRGLQ
mmetsp:Transcript_37489/g.97222  ORF Transcript_37489/g.97222 Transcript_37489/m.97222 type:complete len:259 (-) Transcript_37489:26-802(-)